MFPWGNAPTKGAMGIEPNSAKTRTLHGIYKTDVHQSLIYHLFILKSKFLVTRLQAEIRPGQFGHLPRLGLNFFTLLV
jgi:hypothetical protein